MLDVHPPEHTPHTWRDFFIHIATIVLGLVIAIGLEQSVEAIHHHNQLKQLERDLHEELLLNRDGGVFNLARIDRDMSWLLELRSRVDRLRAGAQRTSFVYPPPPLGYPGDPHHTDRRPPVSAAWVSAEQDGTVALLPRDEAQMYNGFYYLSQSYTDSFNLLTQRWQKLSAFELQFTPSPDASLPDITRMSTLQLDQYSAVISQVFMQARVLKRYLQIQMAYNEDALHGVRTPHDIEQYLQTHIDPLPATYVEPTPGAGFPTSRF